MHKSPATADLESIAARIKGFLAEEAAAANRKQEQHVQEVLAAFRAGQDFARADQDYGGKVMQRLAKLVGISDKTAYKYIHIFRGAGFECLIQQNPAVTKEAWQTIGMTIAPLKDSYFGISVLGVLREKVHELTEDQLKQVARLVSDARKHRKAALKLLAPRATVDKSGEATIDIEFDLDKPDETQRRLAAYFGVDQELDRLWDDCNRVLGKKLFPGGVRNPVIAAYEEQHGVKLANRYGTLPPSAIDAASILRERSRQRKKLPSRQPGDLASYLVFADCLKMIPRLADGSIDVILTDPPYSKYEPWRDSSEVIHDSEKTVSEQIEVIAKAIELAKPKLRERACIFIFFPMDYSDMLLSRLRPIFTSSKDTVWQLLVWDKGITPKTGGTRFFSHQGEAILCCNIGDRPLNVVGGRSLHGNVFRYAKSSVDETYAAWKPIELLKHLIRLTTDKGDLVLDCFGGKGSTGIACNDLKRRFVLIEKNESQFAIAKTNLPDAKPGLA